MREEKVQVAIQVNGKLRGTIEVDSGAAEETVTSLARKEQNVAKYLKKQKIKKTIYIKDRLVNFVT